jgi:hypothetical protein
MLAGGLTSLVLAKEDMLTVSRAQACPVMDAKLDVSKVPAE